MTRHSGIVTYAVTTVPSANGLAQITLPDWPLPPDSTYTFPRHVYEVCPGVESSALSPAPTTVDVIDAVWTVEALEAVYPTQAPYCLDATYVASGSTFIERTRMVAVPSGASIIDSGIAPHQWAGDG